MPDTDEPTERDEGEMRLFTRELFDANDDTAVDPDEDDPSDTRPANQVPREGSNQEPPPDDGTREFVRALFDN